MIELIKDNIERDVYPPGKRLPSERKLATEFNVPQSQIRKALQTLVDEGYLECFRNNGYFVKKNHPTSKKLHRVAFCIEQNSTSREDFYTGLLFNQAVTYDINLLVFTVPPDAKSQNALFQDLLERDVEGIICFPHLIENMLPALLEIRKRGLPFIFWDYSPFNGIFPYVGVNHYQSCFNAARILAGYSEAVSYIGFTGKEQNKQKYEGFMAGCRVFGVKTAEPVFIPYARHAEPDFVYGELNALQAGKMYFASTRLLTRLLVGSMMDKNFMPGRDYRLLGTDMLNMMEGSSFFLDSMMRDSKTLIVSLLNMMRDMIKKSSPVECDYRIEMKYISGKSLA